MGTQPLAALIRVAIVEDQRRTREGLRALIDSSEGYQCVGAWPSVEEALEFEGLNNVNVMLLDLGLPGMSGIEGIGALRKVCPATVIVVLTVYEDNDRVFRALCAGAAGYLLKNTPAPKLLEGLREAVDGGSPMSPEIARRVVEIFRKFQPPEKVEYDLTPHELRLLKLLVDGHSYRSAATQLGTSINTIAFHIKSIYGKLQVHSKSQAVARALHEGLLD